MVIGLPRALLYYKYGPGWQVFLESLGQTVVVSPPTTRKIMKLGSAISENELCMPVKVFFGHCEYLKDKVDALFIPRMVSIEKKTYTCPKFLGLPDMIKAHDGMPEVIDPVVNMRLGKKNYYKSIYQLGRRFSKDKKKIISAYFKAHSRQLEFEKEHLKKKSASAGMPAKKIRIGLAGHPYNLYDDFASMNIIKRLKERNVELVTAETVKSHIIKKAAKVLPKNLFWSYERDVVGAAAHWAKKKLVDGIIYVIAFPCGPDSIIEALLQNITKTQANIPMLSIILDEHSGEAGLVTRIEAFIDQLTERKILNTA